MRYVQENLINAVATSASITSSIVDLNQCFAMSAVITATGSASAGTVKFQVSNDVVQPGHLPTVFADLGSAITVAGAGSQLFAKTDLCYRWLRCIYTDTSGGTGNGILTVKYMSQSI